MLPTKTVIRALWSVIVVCLVAAGGGGGRVSRVPSLAASMASVAPGQIREGLRPEPRASIEGARTAAPERRAPDAVLAAVPSLPAPARRVLVAPARTFASFVACSIPIGLARGPPIA